MALRLFALGCTGAVLISLMSCISNDNPDQIRQKTAQETATLKHDTKAVAEGIKDGLTEKKTVDLNRASRSELASLPGMDDRKAERILAERPYASRHQLVSRHVLTAEEYSRIEDRVTVTR
jgi:DNA uptake protein ComE-like DNA-binding protein